MLQKIILCIVVICMSSTACVAQKVVQEEVVEGYSDMIPPEPVSRGYLTDGATTYGIKGVVVEDDSPLTELKLLRKKFITEQKKTEKMEAEMRMLQERVEHLTMLLEKKNHELEEMQEKGISMRFQYLSLDNKLTNLRMAILRKKLVRESQYPPYYEVKKNDSLWRIAALRNIYDNPYKWLNIYHANQDKISDPDYIYPGMVLTIDRPEMQYEDWTVEGLNLGELEDKMSNFDIGVDAQQNTSVFPINLEKPIEMDNESPLTEEIILNDPDETSNKQEEYTIDEKYFGSE